MFGYAQNVSLGLNAGIVPMRDYGTEPCLSLRVVLDWPCVMVGGALDIMLESGKYSDRQPLLSATPFGNDRYTRLIGNPYAFTNYKFPIYKGYMYIGGNLGYYSTNIPVIEYQYDSKNNITSMTDIATPFTSLSYGAQAGLTIMLTSKVGVNAEAAFRQLAAAGNSQYFPLTVGVRRRL